jgi:hypothetical protein
MIEESAFGVIHKSKGKNARMAANAARRLAEKQRLGSSAATKVNLTAPGQRTTTTVARWPVGPMVTPKKKSTGKLIAIGAGGAAVGAGAGIGAYKYKTLNG